MALQEAASLKNLIKELKSLSQADRIDQIKKFFKVAPGSYGAHDVFVGIYVPDLRLLAKSYSDLNLAEIQELLSSKYNEYRALALMILIKQFQKVDSKTQKKIFEFYIKNIQYINNWNLVDLSAHHIIGAHLHQQDHRLLFTLAKSKKLWERRIAIVATWYFIRQQDLQTTLDLAKILLNDQEDLMHKAVGWMLRELGKKDQKQLESFLKQYASQMPRTMLRYAIEKFPEEKRLKYLQISSKVSV